MDKISSPPCMKKLKKRFSDDCVVPFDSYSRRMMKTAKLARMVKIQRCKRQSDFAVASPVPAVLSISVLFVPVSFFSAALTLVAGAISGLAILTISSWMNVSMGCEVFAQ